MVGKFMSQIEYECKGYNQRTDFRQQLLSDNRVCDVIAKAAQICVEAYRNGKKTLFAGNGGSAADAQHLAGEFVSKFYFDRPGLP